MRNQMSLAPFASRAAGRHRRSPLAAAPLLVLAALALGGCANRQAAVQPTGLPTDNYQQRHPILLVDSTTAIDLPISASQGQLSRDHADVVTAFAQEARERGANFVQVMLPAGAANTQAARSVTGEIRQALSRGGIWGGVVVQTYPVDDASSSAPIRLAYPRIKAEVPHECGRWQEQLAPNFDNVDYWNFGCASQANLAAMVVNPTDFVTPRATTPGDAERRLKILEKFRIGESTRTNHEFKQQGILKLGN